MRRYLTLLLLLTLLLAGCGQPAPQEKQYQASFLTLFDTVTYITGKAESQEVFEARAQEIHDRLYEYHVLFDIYHDYEGITNLKTLNERAGQAPQKVDSRILALLKDGIRYYDLTEGRVNIAMGSVLSLWHEAREAGLRDPEHAALPDRKELEAAAAHTSIRDIILDEEKSTVFFADPELQLDVGAIAKGWSVEQVSRQAPEGLLLSVGGNVSATGPKDPSGTPWVVGINDPDGGENYLHTLYITDSAVVTSGDYQRYYMVDGKRYHHIIDPDTLTSADYWRSVTIVCPDSGLADALSTALFLLPQAGGQALLDSCDAMAMWVDADGNRFYSPGFEELIRV